MPAPASPDPWFRITELEHGVALIEEPGVHPLLRANTWLVRGRDRDLLVDSGLGVVSLRSVACDLAGREPTVVLTHDHLDHMGGAHEFAAVWAHPTEAPDRPRGSLHGPTLARLLGLADDGLPESLLDGPPHEGYDVRSYRLRPVIPSGTLRDGDRIDLGDRSLRVLHLPGHSRGSIGLLDVDTATLFSGDAVYDDDLLDDLDGSDRPAYARTMRRLLGLDVRLVHAGHDHDLDGDRLREIAEAYLAGGPG